MPNRIRSTLSALILCALCLTGTVFAQSTEILITGHLLDSANNPITGARDYAVTFHDAETAGNQLGTTRTGTVEPSAKGMFRISVEPTTGTLAATDAWYQLSIDSDTPTDGIDANDTFPERIPLQSVPFALRATGETLQTITDRGSTTTAAIEVGGLDVDSGTLYVDPATNRVGINEPAPLEELHVRGGDTPAITLDQDTSAGWPTYQWDMAGNEANFFIRDRVADTLPFKIRPGPQRDTLVVGTDGRVAVNLSNPSETLDVNGAVRLRDTNVTTGEERLYNTNGALYWDGARIDVLNEVGESWVIVKPGADPEANGQLLVAAYDTAAALTPHGDALSAANRASVIIPPGNYDLTTVGLTLDTEFVDLVGLTNHYENQRIYGPTNGANSGVLMQTADDVRIMNLLIECTLSGGVIFYSSADPAAYWPDSDLVNTQIYNCEFRTSLAAWAMRVGITYSGYYERCTSLNGGSFGAYAGVASGTFVDCVGGSRSFGSRGTASGTFINCTGATYSFGGDSPTGSGGVASGEFIRCRGGDYSFGANGTAAAGTFYYCDGDGANAWAGDEGTTAYCIKNGVAYP